MEQTLLEQFPDFQTNYDKIVIIPGAGCSTCISSTEEYFKINIGTEKRTLLILTQFANTKLVKINFTSSVISEPNVYLDELNTFNKGYFESMYPQFVYLKEGKIDTIEFASPESPNTLANYKSTLVDLLIN